MSGSNTGVVTSLEEIFLAREFGRETGRHLRAVEEDLGEAPEPRELEDLFLSRDFGRPVALRLVEGDAAREAALPNVVEFPFAGPGAKGWDQPVRQRAVAALSGVAAAAIVLTGLASGTGHSGQPTVSAFGHLPASSGGATRGANVPGPSAGGDANASTGTGATDLTGNSSSGTGGPGVPAFVFAVHQVPPVSSTTGFPSGADAGLASGGQPPPPPPPAPEPSSTSIPSVTTVVGDEVSQAGSTVTATTGDLGSMLPGSGSLATTMRGAGTDVTVLGESIATTPGL